MYIKVFVEPYKELEGLKRIEYIEIETDNESDRDLEDTIYDRLADKEYNTDDIEWKDDLKKDVAIEANCDVSCVEIM